MKIVIVDMDRKIIADNFEAAINDAYKTGVAQFTAEELERVADLFNIFVEKTFEVKEA